MTFLIKNPKFYRNKAKLLFYLHYLTILFILSSSWIVIGLPIHFKNLIWIFNHIFVLDFDWIDNPKKSD
jgi:hypothetical protein